ncbi:MAG: hypothetical protein ACLQLG_04085 [Thermoguttaceae bacterium]
MKEGFIHFLPLPSRLCASARNLTARSTGKASGAQPGGCQFLGIDPPGLPVRSISCDACTARNYFLGGNYESF